MLSKCVSPGALVSHRDGAIFSHSASFVQVRALQTEKSALCKSVSVNIYHPFPSSSPQQPSPGNGNANSREDIMLARWEPWIRTTPQKREGGKKRETGREKES